VRGGYDTEVTGSGNGFDVDVSNGTRNTSETFKDRQRHLNVKVSFTVPFDYD
jgi:hypothetical protein